MKKYSFKFSFSLPERPSFSVADVLSKVSGLFVETLSLAFAAGGAYFGFEFCPFYMTSYIGSSDNGNNFFNALMCLVLGLIVGATVSVLIMTGISYVAEAKSSAKIVAVEPKRVKSFATEEPSEAEKTYNKTVFETEKAYEPENMYQPEKMYEPEKMFESAGTYEPEDIFSGREMLNTEVFRNDEEEIKANCFSDATEPEITDDFDMLEATQRFYDLDKTVMYCPSITRVANHA